MRILIIDSAIQIIDRLESQILEIDKAYSVGKATTFQNAIEFSESWKPDVILLDMNLPANQSFDLLKKLKESGKQQIIIALSIHISESIKEKCKSLGADHFIDKYHDFTLIPALLKKTNTEIEINNYIINPKKTTR